MQDCTRYDEMLNALVDGELNEAEARELNAHLATCAECRSYLRLLQTMHAELGQTLPDPPDTLRKGIMYKVGLERKQRSRAFVRWAVSAAVFCVALLGVVKLTGNDLKSMRSVTADAANSIVGIRADAAANGADAIPENDIAANGSITYMVAAPGAGAPLPQPEGSEPDDMADGADMETVIKEKREDDGKNGMVPAEADENREFVNIYDASNLRGYDTGMEVLNGATAYAAVGILYTMPEGLPGQKWQELIAPVGQRRWLVKKSVMDKLAADNVFDELYFGDLLADNGMIIELTDGED